MGTHPIFESDFDCLTEMRKNICILISRRRSGNGNGKKEITENLKSKLGLASKDEKLSFLSLSTKWQTFTQGVTFQKNLWKYGIVAGIVSTVVFTMYTMLGMQLQAQEMVKNDLDIKIKTYELERLRRELYPEETPAPIPLQNEGETKVSRGWLSWAYGLAYDLPPQTPNK